MQSSTSTSTHQAHPTPFKPAHRRQRSSYNADLQDANVAGRPFAFVPKRRSSSGNMGAVTGNVNDADCTSPQQGQILLVEELALEDSITPQSSPRVFFTFPRSKPETVHGRLPDFDDPTSPLSTASTPTPSAFRLDLGPICAAPTAGPSQVNPAASVDIDETPPFAYSISAGPESTFSRMLIRKKSGEPLKPSLKSSGFATWAASSPGRARTKSAPSTPMGPKFVHFDAQLEHVKLFLAEQKPLAVSRDGSPTETSEGETTDTGYPFPPMKLRIKPITLPSPPPEPWTFNVRLEKVALEDAALVGHVLVRNVAFAKWVAVRFTLDAWQTTSEVTARYVASLYDNSFDRFEFRIRLVDYLNGIEAKRLVLCVRFSVEGREMWDSNGGRNYEVGFERVREEPIRKASAPSQTFGHRAGPTSMTDLRTQLEKVAQDEQPLPPLATALHRKKPRGLRVWLGDRILGDDDDHFSPPHPRSHSPSPLDDKKGAAVAPSLRNVDAPLSARYDFGASLRSPAWTPPQVYTKPPTPSSSVLSKPKTTRQRPKSPPPPTASTSASAFQFPSAGEHRRSMTIPLDGALTFSPRAPCPRGSPRDSADFADEGAEELYRLRVDDDACEDDQQRHHTRGWVHGSSYFDRVAVDAPALKRTPPRTPTVTAPTPPRPGLEFHLSSDESGSSSSPSPSVSPSTCRISLDNVWRTLRQNEDGSLASTPSITTSASSPISLSPLSPPEYLPRAASDDSLAVGAIAGLSRAKRPPINSMPYYSFLDQFCFFTGVTTYHSQSDYHSGDPVPRRAHSASSVEDYFTLSPPVTDDPQSPHSTIGAFPPGLPTTTRSPIPAEFMPTRGLTTACPNTPTEFPQSALSTPVAG